MTLAFCHTLMAITESCYLQHLLQTTSADVFQHTFCVNIALARGRRKRLVTDLKYHAACEMCNKRPLCQALLWVFMSVLQVRFLSGIGLFISYIEALALLFLSNPVPFICSSIMSASLVLCSRTNQIQVRPQRPVQVNPGWIW